MKARRICAGLLLVYGLLMVYLLFLQRTPQLVPLELYIEFSTNLIPLNTIRQQLHLLEGGAFVRFAFINLVGNVEAVSAMTKISFEERLITSQPHNGEIIKVDAGLCDSDKNVEILDVVKNSKKSVDITDAKVLVSGGRGVGGAAGYEPLRALAAELGGEVSSSRIGVDSGWIEKDRQVGQTGKTVHPNLYIACGISGAIQHLAGMEDSDFIIAINKDENCPMMKLADLGIQGDLNVIVPKLTEAIKAYRAKQTV